MCQRFGLFAAGEWRRAKSGAKTEVISPVPWAPPGEAPVASAADTDEELYDHLDVKLAQVVF
jgi:hypothetical protein